MLEINVTPNRGDCFSVIGIARELAARRNVGLAGPTIRRPSPPRSPKPFRLRSACGRELPAIRRPRAARAQDRRADSIVDARAAAARRASADSTDRRRDELRDDRARPALACLRSRQARRPNRGAIRACERKPDALGRPRRHARRRHARDRRCARARRIGRRHGRQVDGGRRRRRTPFCSRAPSSLQPRSPVGRAVSVCTRTLRCASSAASTRRGKCAAIERATELLLADLRRAGRSGRSRRARTPTSRSGPPSRCAVRAFTPFSASKCPTHEVAAIFERLEMRVASHGRRLARDAAAVPLRHRDRGGPDRRGRPHVRLRRDTGHTRRGRRAARPRRLSGPSIRTAWQTCSSRAGTRRPSPTASSTPRWRRW